jgi:outer membrane protein OmpA-like peptidoglycan-associated protein
MRLTFLNRLILGAAGVLAAPALLISQTAPSDSDLYCAGFFTHRAIDGLRVLSSEEAGLKNEFAAGDYVYLDHGRDAIPSPGGQYMLLRPVRDINRQEAFKGQQAMVAGLGTLYAQIARIEVAVLHDRSATARILTSCEPTHTGDIAVPLEPRTAHSYILPKITPRFAEPSGLATGQIAVAKGFDQNLGEGRIVYLNLGTSQGLQSGSYLRIVRSYLSTADTDSGRASAEFLGESAYTGMGESRKLTRAEQQALPREVLGEAMVLSAEEDSATAIVTYSRVEVVVGDQVELEPPRPSSVSCSADPTQVQGGQMVRVSAQATPSMAGDTLTYEWSTTGGTIQGSGPSVQVSTAGLTSGSYVATVRVTERQADAGPGTPTLFTDCSARFSVVNLPTVELSADRAQVQVGEAVNFTARGNSPDSRPLTYQWSTTGGSLQGSGTTGRLDTARVPPGPITVTVRVVDDRNLSAQDSETITAVAPPAPPPPPQTQLLDQCQFALNSARVDNLCKAKLDSIALRLQSEPDAVLAIVGFAAGDEGNPQQLSQTRANNVRAYLSTDKGIAPGRVTSRTGAAGTGPEARRAEMHLVPRGATFTGYE